MQSKFYQLLGIARKGGKVFCGYNKCLETLKHGKIYLFIITENCSQNTLDKFEHLCIQNNVQMIRNCNGEELSRMLGYENLCVVGIGDKGLSDKLSLLWTEENNK